jgi:hypothetical protein
MRHVSEITEQRVGRNEDLFRRTNEAIERGQWGDEPSKEIRFRCECARLECNLPVEVTLADYERVRAFSRRFIVCPGHELPEFETVVDRSDRYVVVEKVDGAGEVAESTDPRSTE